MRLERPGRVLASVVSALPDLTLGLTFLVTWFQPYRFGDRMVKHLVAIMLLEFIIIHSSVFMGTAAISSSTTGQKLKTLAGFGLLYSLFAGAFSLGFQTPWPLIAFWGLTLNRLLRVIIGGAFSEDEKTLMLAEWAMATVFYLLFVFATVILPVPRFGITRAVVSDQEFSGSGLWIDEPHRAIAFGFLYFTTLGLASLTTFKLVPSRESSAQA